MREINFSDGREEILINGKSVFLRLADPNIYVRARKAKRNIDELLGEFDKLPEGNEEAIDLLESSDAKLKAEVNAIFDYDVSGVLFGSCSPLTPIDNEGTTYIQALFEHLMPVIEEELDKSVQASEKRIAKYTAKYQK